MAISSSGITFVKAPAFGRRIIDKQFYPFETTINHDASHIYALLNTVLQKHSTKKTQQLQLILSSDFIRFMVLPAQKTPLSASDQLAFASALYRDVYGAISEAWVIKSDDALPPQPNLCAAIDQTMLEQFRLIASQHQFSLTSIAPYTTELINQFHLKEYDGYLAIIEPSRIVLSHFKGAIQSIQQVKYEDNWIISLQVLLNKAILRNGVSTQNLMIYAPLHHKLENDQFENWNVTFQKPLPSQLQITAQYQMLRGYI
jgi:hypothetical protein